MTEKIKFLIFLWINSGELLSFGSTRIDEDEQIAQLEIILYKKNE